MDVGFIGLGGMGRAMARRLLAAGHTVRVWNRSPGPVAELVAEGATAAGTLAEAFGAEVVVSMLADDRVVESLLLNEELLSGARAAAHVNMATVSPELSRRATELHVRHGIGYVAAPVLGRTDVAEAGNLNILAAGPAAELDRLAPLFEAMGRRTWPLGEDPAAANVAKISANFLLVSAIEAFSEAAALAEANGLDPAALLDVLTNSLFPGPVYAGYGTMITRQSFEPAGFRLALGLKDVNLALEAGTAARVPLPLASLLRDSLLQAVAHGRGEQDLAAISTTSRTRAGI
ncbi:MULTISPECIES: NAD(P)-dependent oxidoreductase [Kitasatospora]|uniref:Putative dehydrogenase n=1 Tax=Kitasatospora setae (strain ATCC 33774 / DSM 43861 / JCM 3304 / KCC A-0304 / NBRC 14216 / KM-6054) TaxID=452652 RepID=E4N360_KITSK|nr:MULTISPECIES: NAD(P)-dependent oxidoreductase [Kitasatospora]BAJ32594.1 putative dehydrogenase [Kitasatospora setae KM-6054]